MQAIVTTLLFPDGAPGPVTEISPWLDTRWEPLDEVIARLEAQTHRRSLKTHTPGDGIPGIRLPPTSWSAGTGATRSCRS